MRCFMFRVLIRVWSWSHSGSATSARADLSFLDIAWGEIDSELHMARGRETSSH